MFKPLIIKKETVGKQNLSTVFSFSAVHPTYYLFIFANRKKAYKDYVKKNC